MFMEKLLPCPIPGCSGNAVARDDKKATCDRCGFTCDESNWQLLLRPDDNGRLQKIVEEMAETALFASVPTMGQIRKIADWAFRLSSIVVPPKRVWVDKKYDGGVYADYPAPYVIPYWAKSVELI
jgi:hypothetical protein